MRMKPLIEGLKIDLRIKLVGSICPYTWIDPEIRGIKALHQKLFLQTFLTHLKMKNKVDSDSITTHSAAYLSLLVRS